LRIECKKQKLRGKFR